MLQRIKDILKKKDLMLKLLCLEKRVQTICCFRKSRFWCQLPRRITHARIQDIPIVSIAAIIQHNTSGFASVEQNITSPKDFEGKTYGGWGSPIEQSVIASLMKQENASIDKVEIHQCRKYRFFYSCCNKISILLGFIMVGLVLKRRFVEKMINMV